MADQFDQFEEAYQSGGSTAPVAAVASDPFDQYEAAYQGTQNTTQPTWGQSAAYVGKSLAQGAAKLGDLGLYLGGEIDGSPLQTLSDQYIGTPESTGVAGKVPEIAKAAVQSSLFPFGGPVLNAVSGVGSEAAHQVFPDSTIAPLLGAVLGAGGVGTVRGLASAAEGTGQALERASLGARVGDYLKSMRINGLQEDEVGDVATKLSKSIANIGDTDGFGAIRTGNSLSDRIGGKLEELGGQIGEGLNAADTAGIAPSVDLTSPTSATQQLIAKSGAAKKSLKDALGEFQSNLLDPQDGWDGSVTDLNKWKTSVANQGFSGTAQGTLAPAMARKLQRAIGSDLGSAVDDAVVSSGHTTADEWDALMSKYGDYKTVEPIVNRQAVGALADSPDKTIRGLLRTSGGALTTPTLIGSVIGGPVGSLIGLGTGATLGGLSTATGRGLAGNALKNVGRNVQGLLEGADLSSVGGLLNSVAGPIPSAQSPTPVVPQSTLNKLATSVLGNTAKEADMPTTKTFNTKVADIAKDLGADPAHLLQVMNFETGGELSSTTTNKAGSGATGLIQFLPTTAKALTGADTKEAAIKILSDMTPTEQLDYVKKYLEPFKGKLNSLDDVYMAVLYPKAVGKGSDYALFKEGTTAYWQNRGLDVNRDGIITKAEATSKVRDYSGTTEV